MRQRGPGHVQRSFFRQPWRVDGKDRSARHAIKHEHSAETHDIQIFVEGCFAHSVVDDFDALAVCQALYFGFKILFGEDDDGVGSGLARQFGLLLARGSADYPRPDRARHLHQQKPDSTRRRVDQRSLARF